MKLNFKCAIKQLNAQLKSKKPDRFTSSWILQNSPKLYHFIFKNIRTENDYIDWDRVVSSLNKNLQPKWVPPRYKPKIVNLYRNKKEVDLVLKKYKDKLYIFISFADESDRPIRDTIIVSLARIAQRGNIRAEEKLIFFLNQVVQIWVELYFPLRRWAGQREELEIKMKHCIRCYRFTGSFLGYLYKTLEYSSWGLQSFQAYSLDACKPDTNWSLLDTLTKDPETGRVVRVKDLGSYYFH